MRDWTVQELRKALDACPPDARIWALDVDKGETRTYSVVNFHMDQISGFATIVIDMPESAKPMRRASDQEIDRRIAAVERAMREEAGIE